MPAEHLPPALSLNKAALLEQGSRIEPGDGLTPEEAIKDPFVLEFLDLKDEYSESELEAALIQHLADFLLEMGDGFTFVGRQRRLRLDDTWFRVDLLLFHRRLKSLDNLPNQVLAAEYRMVLPDAKRLAAELERTRRAFEARQRPALRERPRAAPGEG